MASVLVIKYCLGIIIVGDYIPGIDDSFLNRLTWFSALKDPALFIFKTEPIFSAFFDDPDQETQVVIFFYDL
jgi:hypothetical protein